MGIAIVYITFPNEEKAMEMANLLLEQRLVACANYFPSASQYFWENAIQTDHEWIGLFKTRPEMTDMMVAFVCKNHPYDLPCILSWEVEANEAYQKWVFQQTG